MLKRIRFVVGASLVVMAAASAFGQTYEIKFDRPCKVGEKYKQTVSLDESRSFSFAMTGQPVQAQKMAMKAETEFDQDIQAVNKIGAPSSVSVTIRKWEASINGKPVNEVKAGMAIEVTAVDGEVTIRSKEGEFSPEIEAMLGMIIMPEATDKNANSMDAAFGATERKKAGDSWAVNAAEAAKQFAATGVMVEEKDITGNVTLQKVENVGGIPCAHLEITLNFGNVKSLDIEGTTANVRNGSFKSTSTVDLPLDLSMTEVAATMNGDLNIEAEFPTEQGPAIMKISAITKMKITSNLIK